MDGLSKFKRYLKLQITAAEPETVISRLAEAGVVLFDIRYHDPLTASMLIHKRERRTVNTILERQGVSHRILQRTGYLWRLSHLTGRPVLLCGMLLFLVLSLSISNRVLFVRVEGNNKLPDKLILEQAGECGIGFGSRRRNVRSEKVKNALLEMNPQLQWVGVNTAGCVATIHVRERSEFPQTDTQRGVSSIVAGCDGVISEITVLDGTALCQVGTPVNEGDVLISGYTDCGLKIRAGMAKGEAYAYTLRHVDALLPNKCCQKGDPVSSHTCYGLKIGKKVINFCNDSGIHSTTCDKMYLEEYWTLPGGFSLPVALFTKTCTVRASTAPEGMDDSVIPCLEQYSREYLRGQMVAGKILSEELDFGVYDDFCELSGTYACVEMIGRVKYEETIINHAEDN